MALKKDVLKRIKEKREKVDTYSVKSLRIHDGNYEKLQKLAEKEGWSVNSLINDILDDFLNEG